MKDRKPLSPSFCRYSRQASDAALCVKLELKPLFMLHNFLLSAGSGLLLVLMIEEVRFRAQSA